MTSKSAASAKVKVTASLNPGLVKQIDEFVKETNADSRSQLIEDALEKWCREQKRRKIEKQIEAYYLSLSNDERQEDRDWDQIAAESAASAWED
ncbi:MAG: ribbon-helix-helix domain-containing protein [Desulfoferrobacter sp.]